MSNFLSDLKTRIGDEPVEAVVIGSHGGYDWGDGDDDGDLKYGDPRHIPASRRQVLLTWGEASWFLDYTYDDGFGGADCHPVWVWTPSRVIYVDEYDGSTNVREIPRNPVAGTPTF